MAGEDDVRDDDRTPPPVPSGPAPLIDLGGDAVPVRPVKPLGPRRLARLQRELAERSRELEEAGGSPADPELLEKQRRFAELAAQAGAAQADPGTGTAVQEPAAPEAAAPASPVGLPSPPSSSAPSSPAPRPSAPPEDPGEPLEQITVVFPDGGGPGGPDGHVSHDPVHVDPALFSNRLAPEDLAALTHIEIVAPGDAERHGSHATTPAAPVPDHEVPGSAEDPPVAPPGPAPTEPAAPWSASGDEPPAAPVPASTAEGLELLEPREYRRRTGGAWWVLLLPAVLAALAVVLVLFLL